MAEKLKLFLKMRGIVHISLSSGVVLQTSCAKAEVVALLEQECSLSTAQLVEHVDLERQTISPISHLARQNPMPL